MRYFLSIEYLPVNTQSTIASLLINLHFLFYRLFKYVYPSIESSTRKITFKTLFLSTNYSTIYPPKDYTTPPSSYSNLLEI